ncbi:MAG: radical SAM protein [Clostridia bacterium]|nr:radical SAM protein [Clostridia bacterium]
MTSAAVNIIRKRPVLAIFDVTKHCNQRCPMCNIPDNQAPEMSLDEIKNLVKKLRKFGIGYVFLQGGEPLIRKDIIDIADAFISEGIKPTIITNGVLLTREISVQLAERKCNVAISFDSFDRDNYSFLRGSDDMPAVEKNIRAVASIPERKGNWSVTTTVSKKSDLNDIIKIYDFARDLGFMFAIRPYISVLGTAGKYCGDLSYSGSDIAGIFEHFREIAKKENYLASLIYDYHIRYINGEAMPECDAMKYSFLVRESGKIAPCIEYPKTEIDISDFQGEKKKCRGMLIECNREHPCFYNDAREIGIIVRSFPKIILHAPQIIAQMIRLGNFF